jgi:cytochrome c-type biogenesis protein CcmH/NrfG
MELKDNRSKMYQFGIAGAALLFVSYFMHHAAKISRALPAASGVEKSAADRLGELQKLRDQGLISTDEYTRRRSEIINST